MLPQKTQLRMVSDAILLLEAFRALLFLVYFQRKNFYSYTIPIFHNPLRMGIDVKILKNRNLSQGSKLWRIPSAKARGFVVVNCLIFMDEQFVEWCLPTTRFERFLNNCRHFQPQGLKRRKVEYEVL